MGSSKHIDGIEIYRSDDDKSSIEVRVKSESVWLNLNQLASLFGRDKSVISRHISNIFKEKELSRTSVVAFFATTGTDRKTYQVEHFNLDVIISVGYRVKSRQGTQFRIWANKVIRDYLINGYAINGERILSHTQKIRELESTVSMLSGIINRRTLSVDEATGLLRVITDYAYALDLLDRYDHQLLEVGETSGKGLFQITYQDAVFAIKELSKRTRSHGLFGREKDESLQSSLIAIYQTFGGHELYPSIEEKAANLLYFIVKNHSFIDGNKRIAAFLFLWFLEKNGILYRTDGSRRIADNALVALTLMIAESEPTERDIMLKVIVNLTLLCDFYLLTEARIFLILLIGANARLKPGGIASKVNRRTKEQPMQKRTDACPTLAGSIKNLQKRAPISFAPIGVMSLRNFGATSKGCFRTARTRI